MPHLHEYPDRRIAPEPSTPYRRLHPRSRRYASQVERALAKEATHLYALPPGQYTAARNARAKKLRAKNPELADAVARLPKPSLAAAAVNTLARDQPSEMRELIQAGRRLRAAQEAAVAGKSGAEDLQTALGEHRAALERVRREARRLKLSEAGLERAMKTIRAASVDPELQPMLERGVIGQEVESAGFGVVPSLVAAVGPRRPRSTERRPQRKVADGERRRARERLAAARKVVTELRGEVRRAEKRVEEAEKALALARKQLADAETDVEEARSGSRL